MDRGAWQATAHEMAKSQTPLSDLHFHFTLMTYQAARAVKPLLANAGDARDSGSIPGSERSTGGGHGNLLQYCCLESSMDRGAWKATDHGIAQSGTRLRRLSLQVSATPDVCGVLKKNSQKIHPFHIFNFGGP